MDDMESVLKGLTVRKPSQGYCNRILAVRPVSRESGSPRLWGRRRVWVFSAGAIAALVLVGFGVNHVMNWYQAMPAADRSVPPTVVLKEEGVSPQRKAPMTISKDWSISPYVFSEGLAPAVGKNGRLYQKGYIDRNGKWVIKPKFLLVGKFSQGIATVSEGTWTENETYCIDRTGQRLTADRVARHRVGLQVFKKGRLYGYKDPSTGAVVLEPKWDAAGPFCEGVACVKLFKAGGTRYIDMTGQVVIPPNKFTGRNFHSGLAVAARHGTGKLGFIDRRGKFVIEPEFSEADDFAEGLAHVTVKGKHGFIDTRGNKVIPLVYKGALRFSEGLAAVRVAPPANVQRRADAQGDWGYVDKRGQMIIPTNFRAAGRFSEGLACVKRADGTLSFIDVTGKDVVKIAAGRGD
jgi:hypothetical protein